MHSETYNPRNAYLSPQRKPVAATLLKTYSQRPTSALKAKFEPDTSSHSPFRTDSSKSSKKLSVTRYPTSSINSRAPDPRTQGYRRKNEDSVLSSSLNKSASRWEKQLNIETTGEPSNYNTLNLKGYSVTQNSTSNMLHKSSTVTNTGSYTSKYALYNNPSPLSNNLTNSFSYNRGTTPPNRKVTPLSKDRSKNYVLNTSLPGPSGNEKFFGSNVMESRDLRESRDHSREERDRTNYSHMYNSNANLKNNHANNTFDEEAAYLPPFEPTKCSIKQNGVIKAYAVNTHQGIVRNYNEDRVAIILNIMRPPHVGPNEEWPLCSFFGVYDGHGGTACADFLRDNLHQFVIQDKNFPKNPVEALKKGFEEAERAFKEIAQQPLKHGGDIDRSGSCAIVSLIVEDMCYIANVGDSRAVASFELGKKAIALSRDHKPNDKDEQKRIVSFGGKIYQSQITQPPGAPGPKILLGPHRVFPGRLSVSRTFGDIEAKIPKYGGNPYVVVAEPEIKAYKITKEWDYFCLASDGIFDKLENSDLVNTIKGSTMNRESDVHKQSAVGVERLMKESLIQKTLDNITVVMVAFSGFEKMHSNSDAHEDAREHRREAESAGGHSMHKPTLSATGLNSPERLLNSYYSPLGNRSFTSNHHHNNNDRTIFSSTAKKYQMLTGNSMDYGGNSNSVDKGNDYNWRTGN